VNIELIGGDVLAAKLLAIPEKVRKSVEKEAIAKANKLMISEVQKNAPVETGALKKSIVSVVRTYRKGTVMIGIVGADKNFSGDVVIKNNKRIFKKSKKSIKGTRRPANYSHLVDKGTGIRVTEKGANRGSVTGVNFMQRSMDSMKDQIQTIFETAVENAFNDL
jgi:HK97 gp10 family phage protein